MFDLWSRELAGMHRENGRFALTCHPFISGRASRIALIEELVRYMRRSRGVWFTTCEAIARWHAEQRESAARPRGPRGRSSAARRAAGTIKA